MSELQIMIDASEDDIKFMLSEGTIFIDDDDIEDYEDFGDGDIDTLNLYMSIKANEPDFEDIIQEYLDREEELMILSGGV